MSKQPCYCTIVAVGLWLAGAVPSHASTIVPTPGYAPGIGYEWGVAMSSTDSSIYQGSVGAKSWNEPTNPPDAKGWTHTSDWTALDLTEDATLTVTLARQSGVLYSPPSGPPVTEGDLLTPAFSIYAGWETTGPESHQFNPVGNISWASELSYLDHEANPLGLTSITKTFSLAAGRYSLVFGGNPPDGSTGFHGYQATLTTSPVPLPTAAWLFGSGVAGLIRLARRRAHISE
jgi:hypothetical protein